MKRTKTKKLDHDTKQLIWVFAIIIVIFAAFMVPYFYGQSLKKFELYGVDWYIEKSAGSGPTFYHAVMPKIYDGKVYGNHNVYLRNDPRENSIPASVNISFSRKIIVAQDPEAFNCPDEILVASALGQITALFPFITNVSGAVSDKEKAELWALPFADCSKAKNGTTVFMVRMANESSVTQEGNCYLINVAKCEDNLMVAERFVMEIVDQLNFQKVE
jgi:hypothetical protein